jgi:hypothetical protein
MKSTIAATRISIFLLIILMTGCSASSGGAKQQDYSRLMAGSTGYASNSSTAINDAAGTNLAEANNGAGTNFTAGTNLAANRTKGNTTVGDEIALVKLTNPIARGSIGRLTIQGKPGARYTATAVYKRAGGTMTTVENRTTGIDGIATWKWAVAPDTDPGTYRLTVSGAGKMLTTTYTVQ